jgi:hypothetical protein
MSSSCWTITALAFSSICLVSGQSGTPQTAMIGSMPTSLTAETSEFMEATPPECTKVMAGCKGTFQTKAHSTAGDLAVIDDCTFRVKSWEFDGQGPAVEWWGAKQAGDPKTFPYNEASLKIGELGSPGNYTVGMHSGMLGLPSCEDLPCQNYTRFLGRTDT